MSLTEIFLVAVALAMDAFAVAVASGVALQTVNCIPSFPEDLKRQKIW